MSLAEPVPFIRWRTTQLARFDLSFGIVNAAREVGALIFFPDSHVSRVHFSFR